MEFRSQDDRVVELMGMEDHIGMEAHKSPDVFNFYKPDYQPAGPIARAGLFAPEAGIATGPWLLGYLNGMTSLIEQGLTSCDNGFGRTCPARYNFPTDHPNMEWSDGRVTYTKDGCPGGAKCSAADVVAELDLLLTHGRLNANSTSVIVGAYQNALLSTSSEAAALKVAQKLFLVTAEFSATNMHVPVATPPPPPLPSLAAPGTGFKAVVHIELNGGLDSYNVLIPHSECSAAGKDMFAEYTSLRGAAAMGFNDLLPIDVPSATSFHARTDTVQPCSKFALHPKLEFLRELYQDGDAAFIANIGSLVEPLTGASFTDKSGRTPPQPFAHNVAQQSARTVHPQHSGAKGVLGRMLDALSSQAPPHRIGAFSIGRNGQILESEGRAPDIISEKHGEMRFVGDDASGTLTSSIRQIVGTHGTSLFGETHNHVFETALDRSALVGDALDSVALTGRWQTTSISRQLEQVAKVINASSQLGADRAAFHTLIGGFDTHSDIHETLDEKFDELNAALRTFVTEIKAMGRWDDVVIVPVSEFGRTLTSNGRGTDHGWGGHNMVLGGSVRGGQVLGRYPHGVLESEFYTGRGRIIPSTPFDALWRPVAEWFGVERSLLTKVLPNLPSFDEKANLIRVEELFDMPAESLSPPSPPAPPAPPTPPTAWDTIAASAHRAVDTALATAARAAAAATPTGTTAQPTAAAA